MKIYEYYYDHDTMSLYVEFSTKEDGDKYFRRMDIPFGDVEYYAPIIVTEEDMEHIDKQFISEFLEQYFNENDLPPEEIL